MFWLSCFILKSYLLFLLSRRHDFKLKQETRHDMSASFGDENIWRRCWKTRRARKLLSEFRSVKLLASQIYSPTLCSRKSKGLTSSWLNEYMLKNTCISAPGFSSSAGREQSGQELEA